MTSTPTPFGPAIDMIRAADWGIELASDGTWIVRSPQQDLFALPAEALSGAALRMAAEPYAVDVVVAQLAQFAGALRLDPVPVSCPPWLELSDSLRYGHHRGARNVDAPLHIWRPLPKGRARNRHVTLCGIVMTEVPGAVNLAIPGLRLCRNCVRVLSAMRTGATQTPEPAKPAVLYGWVWEHNTRTIGALGYWRLCNRATGFATSDVPNPPEACTRALTKLRQLLSQATRAGTLGPERAIGVLRAYGWPVEALGDISWRLSSPDRAQTVVIDAEQLVRAAEMLRIQSDQTFDMLVAASRPKTASEGQ